MRRIHVVAFKMAPKYQKEPVQVFDGSAKRNRSGCLHGDGSVWDRNGSKNWTCFFGGPVFGPDRERIDGTVSRSRVNKRPIRHDFWIGTICYRSRVNIALIIIYSKHSEKICSFINETDKRTWWTFIAGNLKGYQT